MIKITTLITLLLMSTNILSQTPKKSESVTINGKKLEGTLLSHNDIIQGGEIIFEMTNIQPTS